MTMTDYVLWGCGGGGQEVRIVIEAEEHRVVLCFEDGVSGDRVWQGISVVSPIEERESVLLTMGEPEVRAARWQTGRELRMSFGQFVSRHAVIQQSTLGSGTIVLPGSVLMGSRVAENVLVGPMVCVNHECVVDAHCHLAPGAMLLGGVHVGEATTIGAHAVILPRLLVGCHCVVGAGAVVTHDVPDGSRVVGVPARPVERRTEMM